MKKRKKHLFLVLFLLSLCIMAVFGIVISILFSDDDTAKQPETITDYITALCTSKGESYVNQSILTVQAIHYLKNQMSDIDDDFVPTVKTIEIQNEPQKKHSSSLSWDEADLVSENETDPVSGNEVEDVTNPNWQQVDDSYFDDALFIGDSRIVGFGLYSKLDRITVYADKGFQIYTVGTKKVVDTPDGKITVPEALAARPMQFKKVYLMFGLNEMGWGSDEQFDNYYYNVIDLVKETQPGAAVYVQSIMHITKEISDKSTQYSNEAINIRNEQLKQIAKTENVYYLDLNEIFTNEDGALQDEYTEDGIHLAGKYIDLWKQYLEAHAIVRDYWYDSEN